MTEFYRDAVLPWGLLRWVKLHCDTHPCEGHKLGVMGIDVCGVMRWVVLVDGIADWAIGAEQRWEAMLAELEDHLVAHYRNVAAALGVDWRAVTFEQLMRQSTVINGLPSTAILEMSAQGEEALLQLRRLVGTDIGAMPVLLHHMGLYRENVGGMPAREGWRP
jgi:hypothetical protein